MKLNYKLFWGLFKPVAVVTIAFIGWWFACDGFTSKTFVAIIAFSLLTRGAAIKNGFLEIYFAIKRWRDSRKQQTNA